MHYVRLSQFYWHFCKSIIFAILYPKRHPELAPLKTGILEPKVGYDFPEFKIEAYMHYKICPKMSVELSKSYIVSRAATRDGSIALKQDLGGSTVGK